MKDYTAIIKTEKYVEVCFYIEDKAVMALGERLNGLREEAYMNGYNWEVVLGYYLGKTAPDLLELGVVDDVIPEPEGGAHQNAAAAFREVDRALSRHLTALLKESGQSLAAGRYQKFRKMGVPPKEEP